MSQSARADGAVKGRKPRGWRRWAKITLAVAAGVLLVYHASILFRVFRLREANPEATALMEQRRQEAAAQGPAPRPEQFWVPLGQISPSLVRAVITGEDPQFYSHSGLDWRSIRRAVWLNWRQKRVVTGASTIDQQLAKNLFFSSSKNPLRKLHEGLVAWEMDHVLGKERVLELYLNVIEWGDGVYGAEAAARRYFNTSAASLNDEQAAFLAAMIPNPREFYNPRLNPERVNYRRDVILALMSQDQTGEERLRSFAVRTVMPSFPEEAKRQRAEGVTITQVSVDEHGNITRAEVLAAPHESIKKAVAEAVTQWKFRPPINNGRPGTLTGRLTFYYMYADGEALVRNPLTEGRERAAH